MKPIIVGVGECKASGTPGRLLKTYALGSCVAVVFTDAENRSAGLAHIALPDSGINPERARTSPAYFADTGIPALLREMIRLGYRGGKKPKVSLVGGANMLDDDNLFQIGERNLTAIRQALAAEGLFVSAQDVGGKISRNVVVQADTGLVIISSRGIGTWEL